MTKGELFELLVDFDDDMEIGFAYPSGDYWRTTIVKNISEVSEEYVKFSSYHEEYVLPKEDAEDSQEDTKAMIVLR